MAEVFPGIWPAPTEAEAEVNVTDAAPRPVIAAEPLSDHEKKMALAESEEVGVPEGSRISQHGAATLIRKGSKKHGAIIRPDIAAIAAEMGLPVSPRAAAGA